MEWKDAVSEVAKYAPAVATALGGPAAGGIASGAASLVTGLLGVENSPAGLVAATQDPEKRNELQRINNEHRQELTRLALESQAKAEAEQTQRLSETQQTMRAELAQEGWFKSGWRPMVGWVLAYAFAALATGLTWVMIQDPSQFPSIVDTAIALIVVMGPVLGLNLRERTKTYQIKAGQRPTTLMDAIKKVK